jgi:hypothetical protein
METNRRNPLRVKRNKYRAIKVKTKDGTFDSKAEYARWIELKTLESAGEISYLRRQAEFQLRAHRAGTPHGERVGGYVADFVYNDKDGNLIVEDVKGVETDMFKWKAKHMLAQYGIEVQIVRRRKK